MVFDDLGILFRVGIDAFGCKWVGLAFGCFVGFDYFRILGLYFGFVIRLFSVVFNLVELYSFGSGTLDFWLVFCGLI